MNLASGMLAGVGASVVSHPFDVVKTRRMASAPPPPPTGAAHGGGGAEGAVALVRAMVAEEGVAALWKGLVRGGREGERGGAEGVTRGGCGRAEWGA